ncbi:MAG: hypothetical protein FWD61_13365 [Phycisphaerales bacterium]|nr:hypothetical protein [Phycisphaerales bacterium]
MMLKVFRRLAIVGVGVGVIVVFAFWLPRHLWRRDWAAAVEQAKRFYDEADRVVASNRKDFVGRGEDGRGYGAKDYGWINGGGGGTFQLRSWPPCWEKMLELANSMHRPRRFGGQCQYGNYFRNAYVRPILFLGDLQTETGQTRFVVVELDDILFEPALPSSNRPDQSDLKLSFTGWLMRLNGETCESCSSPYDTACRMIGARGDMSQEIKLTSYKRDKDRVHPRFRVRLGSTVSVFEIHLEDFEKGPSGSPFDPDDSAKVTIVEIAEKSEPRP